MTSGPRVHLGWPIAALLAVALIAAGAAGTYFMVGRGPMPAERLAPIAPSSVQPAEIRISLSSEAMERAGIRVETVGGSTNGSRVRVAAVIEANGYRSVAVTPIVAGRITNVRATLGETVRRGQTLAEIYSPEVAEAETRYVASRAELDAHERELQRTEELAKIGAASRQELEHVHAEHAAAVTMVQSNRSRLALLGVTDAQLSRLAAGAPVGETASIQAPIDGVITARQANVGLNVDAASNLFTVVDLSTVWVVGDLYERDFGRVKVGTSAIITTTAYPTLNLEGKVAYIDPQVRPETRTAQVRVEVPNPGRQLRPGMYAEMQIGESGEDGRVAIPRTAIQVIGDRTVVYLADAAKTGEFVERDVRLGDTRDKMVEVTSGIQIGDRIVVDGAFALRAERERLGLGVPKSPAADSGRDTQAIRIVVSEKGFDPSHVTVHAGKQARLSFLRTTDATCATEVTVPSLNIKRVLPLNQPIEIEITPQKAGAIAFACGMGMFSGTIVVE